MSVRGIGEGHRPSIEFRTGMVDAGGGVTVDDPARFATVGSVGTTLLVSERVLFPAMGDAAIGMATVPLGELLAELGS